MNFPTNPVVGEYFADYISKTTWTYVSEKDGWFEIINPIPQYRHGMNILNTFSCIKDPTPLEIINEFFRYYLDETGQFFLISQLIKQYELLNEVYDWIYSGHNSKMTKIIIEEIYNETRRFIIENDIKDLKTIPEEAIVLFRLQILR